MSGWLALLLGIVQGLTEFLPVSSSGHLKLLQALFGFENLESYILFDVVCHMGTLLAVFVVLWRPILRLFGKEWFRLVMVVLGTLPLLLILLIKGWLTKIYGTPELLGVWFLLTSLILWIGERWRPVSEPKVKGRLAGDAVGVGFAQLLALLPGVSRSGTTISAARVLGWNRMAAFEFAFLIAIPAILGAMVVTGGECLVNGCPAALSFGSYAIGFIASFVSGWVALLWLRRLMQKASLLPFAWYTLAVGIFSLIYMNLVG